MQASGQDQVVRNILPSRGCREVNVAEAGGIKPTPYNSWIYGHQRSALVGIPSAVGTCMFKTRFGPFYLCMFHVCVGVAV